MSTVTSLILYLRQDCSLCEEMIAELVALRARLDIEVRLVDIDADEDLRQRFDHKVPVLVEGDEEICHHFLDEDMLLAHLQQRQASSS